MAISRDEIFERVREVLVDALGVDDEEVQPDASLTSDLGAESIDFLDIVFRIEKEFGFKIAQGEFLPENVLQNEEYVQDGKITEKGITQLKASMPHVDFSSLAPGSEIENVQNAFTVNAVVSFVEKKLAA